MTAPLGSQLRLDRRHDAVLQVLDSDLGHQLGEEAPDDQPPRVLERDAAGHQVERVLVVEPAAGGGVPRAGHLAGEDLQVRHRVGVRAVGQDQVPVVLVGVGAGRLRADQHVADPDRARALAVAARPCRRRGCGSSACRGRRTAGAPGAGRRRRRRCRSARRRRRAGVPDRRREPDQRAAEGDREVRAGARPGPRWPGGGRPARCRPPSRPARPRPGRRRRRRGSRRCRRRWPIPAGR